MGKIAVVRGVVLMALVVVAVAMGGKRVGVGAAQVHHVVGGDPGWDPSSDVASWASGRTFRVGDKIWFAYSAAQETIVELKSKEEYESCDVSNPIKMYTDGLDSVSLDGEASRYFASGKLESCKNGLKLHVEVQPQAQTVATSEFSAKAVAAPPTTPSASANLNVLSYVLFVGLLLCYLGL